jgi:DNA-binding HxlR family transcriptional regulator
MKVNYENKKNEAMPRLRFSKADKRYNEIKRGLLAGVDESIEIAPRVLSRELKQLCEFKILKRHDFKTLPPKVEYSLTDAGESFLPVIEAMHLWGVKFLRG